MLCYLFIYLRASQQDSMNSGVEGEGQRSRLLVEQEAPRQDPISGP